MAKKDGAQAPSQKRRQKGPIQRQEVARVNPDPQVGLTMAEYRLRQEAGWSNIPGESPSKSDGQIIRENVCTIFNLVFVVLAVCLALVGSYKNMSFLLVAFVNLVIGTFQEIRAKRAVDKLTLVAAQTYRVVREGVELTLRSDLLVRDDIVIFGAGDQICADGVLREGELQVNESLITGESDAIVKKPGDELRSGSFVIAGTGRVQLTEVGPDAFAAKLSAEAKKNVHATESEMMRSLDRLIRFIGIILVPVGCALFYQQFKKLDLGLKTSMESMVAALVGMIPEGLYLLTSVAMAVSSRILAGRKVLVQDMNSIETLARVDVLCADKTGTITETKMEVQELIPLGGDGPEFLEGLLSSMYAGEAENDTARAMKETYSRENPWSCDGNIPFTSAAKWSAQRFGDKGWFVSGAPEIILGERYDEVRSLAEPWAEAGCRVLLIAAYGEEPKTGEKLDPLAVRPVAMAVLTNRVRPEAPETFRYFAEQGVSIRVISGDNPVTVAAVAQRAGIEGADRWVDASTLDTDEAVENAARDCVVFGRVTPEMKRRLVLALKGQGHTVAMTSDGVNDVLALKEADCGIAMASGSQAASQVAQIVLLRSDFSAMPKVVLEGRRVINNIQRAAALFLVKNIFSLFLALLSLFAGFPYPLRPIQLSMISTLCIGVPSFFLALEPNYDRVEGHFMSNVLRRAFPGGLASLFVVLAAEAFLHVFHMPMDQLYTACTALVAFVGIMVLYHVCRPFNWKRVLLLLGMILGILGCFVYLPWIFEYVTLPTAWTLVLGVLLVAAPTVYRVMQGIFDFSLRKFREKMAPWLDQQKLEWHAEWDRRRAERAERKELNRKDKAE